MKNQEAEHTKNLTFKEKLLLAQGRLQQNSKIQAPINSKEKISKDQQDMGQNVKCMSLQSNTNAKNKNEADGLTFKDKLRFAQLNSESSNKIEKNEIKEKPQEIPVPKNKKEIENNEIESQEKKLDITKNIAKEEIKKEDHYSNVENKTIDRPNGLSFQEKLRLAQSYSQSEQNNQSTKLSTPGDIKKADNCVISDSKKEIQSFQEEQKNDSKQNRKSSVQNDSKNGTASMSFKEKIKFAQDYSQSNLNAQRKDSKEINRTEEQVESKIFEKNEIKNPNNDDISLTNSEIKQKNEAKEISFKEKLKFTQEFAKPCQEIGQTEKFSTINEKKKEQDIQKYSSVDNKAQIENIENKENSNKETLSSGFKEKLRLAQERAQNSVQEQQKSINLTQKDEKMKEPKEIKTSDSNLNKENTFDIKTREDDNNKKSNISKKEISQQWNSILSAIQQKKPISQTNSTSKEEKEKIVPNEMNLNRNSSLNTIKTQTEIKGQTLDANRAQSKNDLIKEKNDLVEDNNMQAIQIDLVNNKDVHKKLVEIQSNINDSTVMMDKKHIYVIKNTFESFLNSIIFEAVVENIKNGQQSMIPELYKAKIQSLSETIHFLVSIVDEIYDDKYKDISEEEETNDKAEIMANTTLYVMSEKQSFKEITIDITSESDLNSKIPQDF